MCCSVPTLEGDLWRNARRSGFRVLPVSEYGTLKHDRCFCACKANFQKMDCKCSQRGPTAREEGRRAASDERQAVSKQTPAEILA